MDTPFDEDENEPGMGSDSASMKQLRDYAKRLERELTSVKKDSEAALGKLAEYETKARADQVASIFNEAKLSAKHAALFAKLNPEGEVTLEKVTAFADEYELPRGEAPQAEEPVEPPVEEWQDGTIKAVTPPEKAQGFAPVGTGGGTPPASVIDDPEVAQKLYLDNPTEYLRLREAGRIKLATLPGSQS